MGRTPAYDICPDPVYGYIGFVGYVFSWGLAGGSAVHFVKGFRTSPSGARLAGAVNAVRQNAPRVAGRFGAYCIFISVIEIAASLALPRDDYLTAGTATAATGGLHGMLRRGGGGRAAARCALIAATGFVGLELALDRVLRVMANRLYPQKKADEPSAQALGRRIILPTPTVVEDVSVWYKGKSPDRHGSPKILAWNRDRNFKRVIGTLGQFFSFWDEMDNRLLDTVADPTLKWSPDETLAASEIT